MIPQRFKEANVVMKRPANMTELRAGVALECYDVHACRSGGQVVTCWRPSPEELVKINLGEPVWLIVVGKTMPPVCVTADRPFEEPDDREQL